jgi:predicted  nucleic acid-binding Zn-ribbon protein
MQQNQEKEKELQRNIDDAKRKLTRVEEDLALEMDTYKTWNNLSEDVQTRYTEYQSQLEAVTLKLEIVDLEMKQAVETYETTKEKTDALVQQAASQYERYRNVAPDE